MLMLLTSNPKKYEALADVLESLRIAIKVPDVELPELQHDDLLTVLAHKARAARDALGAPCLVDDCALMLEAYPGFPGPLTRSVCRLLGAEGLGRLLTGCSGRARMKCLIGCMVDEQLWHWCGEVAGRVDVSRNAASGLAPLTDWFAPDAAEKAEPLGHRRLALCALARDIDRLRHALLVPAEEVQDPAGGCPGCAFCDEFRGGEDSLFHRLAQGAIPGRILHRTPHFVVFPPLGEFVEGGLLLATRRHLLSMARLPGDYYPELEQLMEETSRLLEKYYGCRPLYFEHAPVDVGNKGTCCVDHAHLNVFPVRVDVHAQLQQFPHATIDRMCQLAQGPHGEGPYLFLQTNDARRYVYRTGVVPSQYIRQIIALDLGVPQRWHWRDYLGLDELNRTLATLVGWR
jgi:inosine/xanthosine triphosphate pyrophosphatase family protein/diadenosine tetraphosphate (Ap4A) HIT family hydrolase